MSPASSLRQLVDIMSKAVDVIDVSYSSAETEFPSLDAPFDPNSPSEMLLGSPVVVENSMLAIAAANQLMAALRVPGAMIFDLALSSYIAAAMQTILVTNIPEIVREAGAAGIHAKDIGAKTNMDPINISRCLRLLATYHVFREVSPDVWAQNRLSTLLDTGKSYDEIVNSDPTKKHVGTPGIAALMEVATDEFFRSSVAIADVFTEPLKQCDSSHDSAELPALDSPFNRVYNTKLSLFEWYQRPENRKQGIRFDIAMAGTHTLDAGGTIMRGFPWASISACGTVVDVGGGIGALSLPVAKEHSCMKFIVQDLPTVVSGTAATDLWNTQLPGALDSGRVTFQGHDFFTPQPVRDADLFMVRGVLHDWPTAHAKRILTHLRAAAVPGKTRLLMVEQVVPYACEDTSETRDIPGALQPPVPAPLLRNLGRANSLSYLIDFLMAVPGGQERTLGELNAIAEETGWKIVHVYTAPGSPWKHILAV